MKYILPIFIVIVIALIAVSRKENKRLQIAEPEFHADLNKGFKKIMIQVEKGEKNILEIHPELVQLFTDYVKSAEASNDLAKIIDAYAVGLHFLKTSGQDDSQKLKENLKNGLYGSVKKYPNESVLVQLLADYQDIIEMDIESAIKSYAKCYKIDRHDDCKKAHEQLVAEYRKPVCFGNNTSSKLGFYLVSKNKDKATYANKPSLTNKDIQYILVKEEFLTIYLTEKGKEAFTKLTKENIGKDLAILKGDEQIFKATIHEEINSGSLSVSPGNEPLDVFKENICTKYETRELSKLMTLK